MKWPKSKVYRCFFKLSGIFLHKHWNIHYYCRNTPQNYICAVLTLRFYWINTVSPNQRGAKYGNFLIIEYQPFFVFVIFTNLSRLQFIWHFLLGSFYCEIRQKIKARKIYHILYVNTLFSLWISYPLFRGYKISKTLHASFTHHSNK